MVLKYLSSNEVGESNDETNFTHKLLLTNTQVSKTFEAFTNGSSADVKFPKNQLSKMVQLGGNKKKKQSSIFFLVYNTCCKYIQSI